LSLQKLYDIKIESAKDEFESKRSQLIASPARLKADLDAAARAVDEAKTTLSGVDMDRRALVRRIEIVAKADKDVHKTLTLLADFEVRFALMDGCGCTDAPVSRWKNFAGGNS
jgi:hypothetical protein